MLHIYQAPFSQATMYTGNPVVASIESRAHSASLPPNPQLSSINERRLSVLESVLVDVATASGPERTVWLAHDVVYGLVHCRALA